MGKRPVHPVALGRIVARHKMQPCLRIVIFEQHQLVKTVRVGQPRVGHRIQPRVDFGVVEQRRAARDVVGDGLSHPREAGREGRGVVEELDELLGHDAHASPTQRPPVHDRA